MRKQVIKRHSRFNRPKTRLLLPGDAGFRRRNYTKRLLVWLRQRSLYFLLLALLVWLGHFLLTSPRFQVQEAKIIGNKMLSVEQVAEAAAVRDKNIFLISQKTIGQALLGNLRTLKSVNIHSALPNQVTIEVTEWQPAYIWKVGQNLYVVSREGIVVGTTATLGLPIGIVDVDGEPVKIGDQVDREALATAEILFNRLPTVSGVTAKYFEYSHTQGIIAPIEPGIRVCFGRQGDLESKMLLLKSILDKAKQDNLKMQFIDLRFKGQAYFR
ncbi:MAG: FtsQ-type POTRA domain-containing protein [Chloroflexi bacterium]|nr:FtsQ-type POTRA domain-containing protein [Chloroflexota bacterium]MCL5075645.1 FtsQ-type POTRA domain-containing protein [Chloroflexota bacterium]